MAWRKGAPGRRHGRALTSRRDLNTGRRGRRHPVPGLGRCAGSRASEFCGLPSRVQGPVRPGRAGARLGVYCLRPKCLHRRLQAGFKACRDLATWAFGLQRRDRDRAGLGPGGLRWNGCPSRLLSAVGHCRWPLSSLPPTSPPPAPLSLAGCGGATRGPEEGPPGRAVGGRAAAGGGAQDSEARILLAGEGWAEGIGAFLSERPARDSLSPACVSESASRQEWPTLSNGRRRLSGASSGR